MRHALITTTFLLLFLFVSFKSNAQNDSYTVYAALYKENNLALISPEKGRIIQRIQVGRNPDYIAFNATKNRLYVSNTGEITVSVVDIVSNKVINVHRLPVNRRGIYAGVMVASPDGKRMYVAERPDEPEPLRIYVLDTEKDRQVAQFNVGDNVNSMSVSHDGKKLFVVEKGKSITVYNTETYATMGTVPLLEGLVDKVENIACSPAEAKAFITYSNANKLQVISTDTYKTTAECEPDRHKTGTQRDIFVPNDGKYAFVINDKDALKDVEGILVYDVEKNEYIKIFNAGYVPRGMGVSDDETRFFVASNYLKWYNMLTLEHIASMSLRTEIRGIQILKNK
ncbi:MAG: hypothetical protein CL946_01065 [Ectothiorhodospiraceae bacterium]|nr:hypothetical protein [Ectothiorhodospiraceae bacterium]